MGQVSYLKKSPTQPTFNSQSGCCWFIFVIKGVFARAFWFLVINLSSMDCCLLPDFVLGAWGDHLRALHLSTGLGEQAAGDSSVLLLHFPALQFLLKDWRWHWNYKQSKGFVCFALFALFSRLLCLGVKATAERLNIKKNPLTSVLLTEVLKEAFKREGEGFWMENWTKIMFRERKK